MKSNIHIIVSAENNPYVAWQCKLFHYSCVTRLKESPVIVVHDLDRDWHSDFVDIVKAGGKIRRAPSYRTTKAGDDYCPRNTAGTLLQASEMGYKPGDLIVLCDPDMIFLRPPVFPKHLAADYYPELNFDQSDVRAAARRLGIDADLLKRRKREMLCGVPYAVPVAQARELAESWLEAIDAFTPGTWEISMYAFGLAVMKLGLKLASTHIVTTNFRQHDPVRTADIVHYSYGDSAWNKRDYFFARQVHKVWNTTAKASKGTILGEIVSQIAEASDFYSNKQAQSFI